MRAAKEIERRSKAPSALATQVLIEPTPNVLGLFATANQAAAALPVRAVSPVGVTMSMATISLALVLARLWKELSIFVVNVPEVAAQDASVLPLAHSFSKCRVGFEPTFNGITTRGLIPISLPTRGFLLGVNRGYRSRRRQVHSLRFYL